MWVSAELLQRTAMFISRLLSHEHVLNVITSRETELVFDFHKKLMRETDRDRQIGEFTWLIFYPAAVVNVPLI